MDGYGKKLFPLMTALLLSAEVSRRKFKALPEEEQQRIIREREKEEELRRVQKAVQVGKCPECGNKLTRGKKDKGNGYKRKCECPQCKSVYYR